jgi:fermentation-respiration switch protein FrsA (DUF1100 family)
MGKRPRVLRLAAYLFAGAIGVFFMLRWFEHSQIYYPDRVLTTTGAELGRPWEDVEFTALDGTTLNGWFFPGSTNAPRRQWVVLLCHGNAGNISHRLGTCQALLATGVSVFVFDYRGYGRSEGRPSEEGTYLDAQAAYRWLRTKGFDGGQVIAFGESLGGGVASELALREPLGGLVLQSTFSSITDLGAELFPWLPVRWLSTIKYETRRKLPQIKIPVMVMHSRSDELVGFHHAERNFAAANAPKLFCELKGGHNDGLVDRRQFVSKTEQFLSMVEAASRTAEVNGLRNH